MKVARRRTLASAWRRVCVVAWRRTGCVEERATRKGDTKEAVIDGDEKSVYADVRVDKVREEKYDKEAWGKEVRTMDRVLEENGEADMGDLSMWANMEIDEQREEMCDKEWKGNDVMMDELSGKNVVVDKGENGVYASVEMDELRGQKRVYADVVVDKLCEERCEKEAWRKEVMLMDGVFGKEVVIDVDEDIVCANVGGGQVARGELRQGGEGEGCDDDGYVEWGEGGDRQGREGLCQRGGGRVARGEVRRGYVGTGDYDRRDNWGKKR